MRRVCVCEGGGGGGREAANESRRQNLKGRISYQWAKHTDNYVVLGAAGFNQIKGKPLMVYDFSIEAGLSFSNGGKPKRGTIIDKSCHNGREESVGLCKARGNLIQTSSDSAWLICNAHTLAKNDRQTRPLYPLIHNINTHTHTL